jgi:hypothetical protein
MSSSWTNDGLGIATLASTLNQGPWSWKDWLLATPANQSRLLMENFRVKPLHAEVISKYSPREKLEETLRDHLRKEQPDRFLVFVGPHGAGKTSLVRKVLRDRGKVVYVELTSSTKTIVDKIREGLFVANTTKFELDGVFEPFRDAKGEDKPVVVIELDSEVSAGLVETQSAEAKKLVDGRYCHVVLVLSDANAAFKLNSGGREDFLWVGDFTPAEANFFLDKCQVLLTDDETPDGPSSTLRQRIFDEVGANPLALNMAANDARRAAWKSLKLVAPAASVEERLAAWRSGERKFFEEFIEEQKTRAYRGVVLSMSRIPETKAIMRALLDSPSSAVNPADVNATGQEVMEKLKEKRLRAVTYNSQTDHFEFYSKAYAWAARACFEE